MEIIGR